MQETLVQFLSQEDPLEKGKATHSSILAWRIPGAIQSMGLQRVGHNWATFIFYIPIKVFFFLAPFLKIRNFIMFFHMLFDDNLP